MAKTFDLSVIFNVINRASAPIDKIGKSFARLTNQVQKASAKLQGFGTKMKAFGQKTKALGKNLAARLSLPIVGFAALVGKTVVGFDQAMNKVQAVTGATGKTFEKLEARARSLGETTQFSASEAAEAMTFLGMAGLSTEQIYDSLPGVLQLAAAGGLDLASAADIATNVMSSMGKEVKDLSHINDVLAKTANSANTDVRQLAEALRPVAGISSSLGVSLEETAALLGKLADSGEKGGAAGTFLMNAMLAVIKPTNKARNAFERMGIDLTNFVDDSGKLKNFSGLMEIIQNKGAKAADVYDAFGVRGARAVLNLTKKGKNLKDFTQALVDSGGAADKAAKAMMKGLPGAVKSLQSAFEGFMLSLAKSGIGEFFEKVMLNVAGFFRGLSKTNPAILNMVVVVAGLVAALGPLLIVVGSLTAAWGALSAVSWPVIAGIVLVAGAIALVLRFGHPFLALIGLLTIAMLTLTSVSAPFTLIIAAIAAGAYLIIRNWTPISDFFVGIWTDFVDMAKFAWDAFTDMVEVMDPIGLLANVWNGVSDFFAGVWGDVLSSIPEPLKNIFGLGGGAKVDVSGAISKDAKSLNETDVKIKLDVPAGMTGTVISKKQKGENSKVGVKLNNVFAGPTLAGVQ